MPIRTDLRLAVATAVTASLTGGLLGLATGTATAVPAKAAAPAPAKPAKYADDFNGDGYRDYAFDNRSNGVIVTYGTASGPGTKTFTFDQDSPGIPGSRTGNDGFGWAIANADFNSDGYADLAVSDPGEKVGKHKSRGMVVIVWGSKSGLGSKASSLAVKSPWEHQRFGRHLATGDFSGDGKPDLALTDTWSVHIYRGGFSSKTGATGKVSTFDRQHDHMLEATALAAGKVDKDKATDLYVIGVGYRNDRHTSGTWFLKGGSTIKPGKAATYNSSAPNYRATGVVADFDKDGYGDLAVSDLPYKKDSGAVVVLRGGKDGPGTSYRLTQDTAGVATAATSGDWFGYALSAGDTNRDGYPDLGVGTFETLGKLRSAGGAHVLHGGKKGLTGKDSRWFTRATIGVPGEAREGGLFGEGVRLRDFDRDGDADLLISGDSFAGEYDGTLLGGSPLGVTTGQIREVGITAQFPQ
ncbi:FG-GAP repeat domain-containing protein [Streptomyces katsurahamanus]|uniref:VCBS repeat-containing protein n=1 Tax=Streptomyces katsurahamanus TaxID=2577098 RepID=A0ABW9NQG3_9ACTN|nr:VCBS repeat-containing protein [Streptomyces katsurahamanus]MQS35299.1 VCBS repeat-containing protein [Streptomyces katsurahamanus]